MFGRLLKHIVPNKVKQFLFDKAIDGGLSRLGKWIKSRFTSFPGSHDRPTPPPIEKEVIGPKQRFVDNGPSSRRKRKP